MSPVELELIRDRRIVGAAGFAAVAVFAFVACSEATEVVPGGSGAGGTSDTSGSASNCAAGQTLCDGECVDLTSDESNCGACGKTVAPPSRCTFTSTSATSPI